MLTNLKIFIDCDGVLNDFGLDFYNFVKSLGHEKILKPLVKIKSYSLGDWFESSCSDSFKKSIIEKVFNDYNFWIGLTPYSESIEDMKTLMSGEFKDRTFIATTPANEVSIEGKTAWFQRYFPFIPFDNIIYIKDKSLLAKEGSYLIDDYPKNVTSFGKGYLFQQFYNINEWKDHSTTDFICSAIEEIKVKEGII
jgi:5'(3')-deoxyribonucleotidase